MTVADALAQARTRLPASEARWLLQQVLKLSAAQLATHPERALSPEQRAQYETLIARRCAGEPIAYLNGQREFFGRLFKVSPAVLIPRPETELLVELALQKARQLQTRPRLLDLGTGSGCIAISLALEIEADVFAVDLSPAALAVARANAQALGATVHWLQGHWAAAIAGRFDIVVSNPPYIPDADPHLNQGDLPFEPTLALASGADGLSSIRTLLTQIPGLLKPGGCCLIEHGYDQAEAMRELLQQTPLQNIEQTRDLAGIIRVSGGTLGGH